MKALVIGGCGKIGRAVAWDLVTNYDFETVGVADANEPGLKDVQRWLGDKVAVHALNVSDAVRVAQMMKGLRCGGQHPAEPPHQLPGARGGHRGRRELRRRARGVPPPPGRGRGRGLNRHGMSYEDYGEWLHEQAEKKGITILDGMGFAPGLSNVTTGHAIRKMDTVERAVARVGGIPCKEAAARHPLKYMITWAFSHVLREYMISVQIIKNGKADRGPGAC